MSANTGKMTMRFLASLSSLIFAFVAAASEAYAIGPMTADIDGWAESARETFSVPGVAIGIIKDGEIIHAKGYGVLEAGKNARVDEHTIFSIGSITKTFTSGAIALLVAEGKLDWDDKVVDHIPGFRLSDPWITHEVTVRDLLSHRIGLSPGAGGLMFYASNDFSREELIEKMRHFRQSSGFRTKFVYDNLAYVVLGDIIERTTGKAYEDFIDKRLIKPIGMDECAANTRKLSRYKNNASPHTMVDGHIEVARRLSPMTQAAPFAAAGGVYCSVDSLLRYLRVHLNDGVLSNGHILFNAEEHEEMWTPQTLGSVSDREREWDEMNFTTYGLGWQVSDMHGMKTVSHGGGVPGVRSFIMIVPELNLATVVLTNYGERTAMDALTAQIVKSFMPVEKQNWIAKYNEKRIERARTFEALSKHEPHAQAAVAPTLPLAAYVGEYRDSWFGDVAILLDENGLSFTAARSKLLTGRLEPVSGNLFIVRWNDRGLNADALVDFDVNFDGVPETIKLKAVSPATSAIYDFHDLSLTRHARPDQ